MMNQYDTVVVGGGIAGLLYSYYYKVPVFLDKLSPLPLCAYLHDTREARGFLLELGIVPDLQPVSHKVFWEGKLQSWPSPPAAHAAYFAKTRKDNLEVSEFSERKGQTSQQSIARMSRVYIELFQHLKLQGLVVHTAGPIAVSRGLTTDNFLLTDPYSGNKYSVRSLKLAAPPESIGITEQTPRAPKVRNVFDTFKVGTGFDMPEILYVSDPAYAAYRFSRLAPDYVLAEQAVAVDDAHDIAVDDNQIMRELRHVTGNYSDDVKHADRRTFFGYYERSYDLPPGIELVGRVATGNPLLTHHLIEKFSKETR